MSKIVRYKFYLESISPLYFGSDERGQLIRNSTEKPFITGNSIGGAIRNFLIKYKKEIIIENLGGKIDQNNKDDKQYKYQFIESSIIISDGYIEQSEEFINKKEGTKVDINTATADDGSKYEFEYLSKGIKISFELEKECKNPLEEEKIKKFISYIADGFNSGELTLGGHYNEGFGRFNIEKLEKIEFDLTKQASLENYIFNRDNEVGKIVDIKEYINNYFKYNNAVFKLEGYFPYGVYQNFDIKDSIKLSGIQKDKDQYYIPASSIKGLIKSEIEKLYNSLGKCGDKISEELFGGKDSKGKIRFEDVLLYDAKEIEVLKAEHYIPHENKNPHPTYNKVDRLTGGSYNNALFSQRDIEGKGLIKLTLSDFDNSKKYIYPLLIILRNIGLGIIPIGGRTSIGLGEFKANNINLITNKDTINIEFDNKGLITIDDAKKLDEYKGAFKKALKLWEATNE